MEIKVLALPEVAEMYVGFDLGGWERLSLNAAFPAFVTLQTGSTLLPSPGTHLNQPSPASPPFLPLRATVDTEELERTLQRFGGTP